MRKLKFLPDGKEKDSGSLLPWVIAVMVYLSALALVGSLSLHGAVASWTADITHTLTVQIVNPDNAARDSEAKAAVARLAATPGVAKVRILGKGEIDKLLEPWLGEGNVSDDLPVPALIELVLDPHAAVSKEALAAGLRQVAPDAKLDDHQQWIGQLMTLANIIEITAVAIVFLILLATIIIVMFGAKAGMTSHHETIETLHIMGAMDRVIAGTFQRRFMLYGFKGGVIGLVLAGITVGAMINVASDLGGGLMMPAALPMPEIATLASLPLLAGLIAMLTARFTVLGALARMV